MADDNLGNRIAELEKEFSRIHGYLSATKMWGSFLGIGILAWLSITSFFQIPAAVKNWIDKAGGESAITHINQKKEEAELTTQKIKDILGGLEKAPKFSFGRNDAGHPIIEADKDENLNLKPAVDGRAVIVRDGNTGKGIKLYGGGYNSIQSVKDDGSSPFALSLQPSGGNIVIGKDKTPDHPLEMASGAYVSREGVWTNSSSQEYKKDVALLTVDQALETLIGLNPVTFGYKVAEDKKHVGFLAEEVPELVATKDRKGLSPMDIVAILTKVVQYQREEIEKLKAHLNARQ